MVDTVIPLSKSYTAQDKTFNAVRLREPGYSDIYMSGLGMPQEWQPGKDGMIAVTYPTVVDDYLKRIVVEPGYEYIADLGASDSMLLEKAVCAFFIKRATSEAPPTG